MLRLPSRRDRDAYGIGPNQCYFISAVLVFDYWEIDNNILFPRACKSDVLDRVRQVSYRGLVGPRLIGFQNIIHVPCGAVFHDRFVPDRQIAIRVCGVHIDGRICNVGADAHTLAGWVEDANLQDHISECVINRLLGANGDRDRRRLIAREAQVPQ